ncbi:plancitoxin-1-like [Saccostrea cucullata]|uniref:plancitoxin-1-like n=1 Tax=Saccostrea cuccullata TaxID=36930 RepID=UPI002ED119E7
MVTPVPSLTVILFTILIQPSFCLNCVSPSGKPVDWYIMYKIPRPTKRTPANTTGEEFYYLDSVNPVFVFKGVSIQKEKENPLFKTLQQIYDGKSSVYAMYNDEPPNRYTTWFTAESNRTAYWETNGGAHMKGAYAFDENEGFWLILSIPKFPAPRKQGYSYGHSQIREGQSILCVTLDKQYLKAEMEKIFHITKPTIYDDNTAMKTGQKYSSPSSTTFTVVDLKSKGGQEFRFFAKSDKFGMDLYDAFVAKDLKDNMYVETWHPSLKSNCSTQYKVYNVEKVKFANHYKFMSTTDHSKWAVTENREWTCIGDINRATSQFKRGGGTMCFYHGKVSQQFRQLIGEYHKC